MKIQSIGLLVIWFFVDHISRVGFLFRLGRHLYQLLELAMPAKKMLKVSKRMVAMQFE